MNWLDWLVVGMLAWAAIKGFMRGFIVELASLVAVLLGIWAGVHLSARVAEAIGLDPENTALAFLVTFLLVVILVHLLARALTAVVNIAQLGLPNKLAGVIMAALRSAFMLSVALNLALGWSGGTQPNRQARETSLLYRPLQAFAPLIMPALGDTKWLKDASERLQEELNVGLP